MIPSVSVPAFAGLNGTTAPAGASSEDVRVATEVPGVAGSDGTDGVNGVGKADGLGADDESDLVRIIATGHHPHLLWVQEHLEHLSSHAQAITKPATHVAEQRRQPWWR